MGYVTPRWFTKSVLLCIIVCAIIKLTKIRTRPARDFLAGFYFGGKQCREDQTHRASTRAAQGSFLTAASTARSMLRCTPGTLRQHRRKGTARVGRRSPGHFFVRIHCAFGASRKEGTSRRRLSTISYRTGEILDSSGIGATGSHFARNAMTIKR